MLGYFIFRLIFYNKNPPTESPSKHEGRLQERSACQEAPTTATAQANNTCLNAGAKACLVFYCNHALQKKLACWKQFAISYHESISQWNSYISFINPGNELFISCFKALGFANTVYCCSLRTLQAICHNTRNMALSWHSPVVVTGIVNAFPVIWPSVQLWSCNSGTTLCYLPLDI